MSHRHVSNEQCIFFTFFIALKRRLGSAAFWGKMGCLGSAPFLGSEMCFESATFWGNKEVFGFSCILGQNEGVKLQLHFISKSAASLGISSTSESA